MKEIFKNVTVSRFFSHFVSPLRCSAAMDELRAGYENRISFLLAQIAKKDERMDRKDAIIERLMAKAL